MVDHSVKAFVKRIITNRNRFNSWSKDKAHNRLYTIIPISSVSPEFVNHMMSTNLVHKFKFNRKLTINVTVGVKNIIMIIH